MSHRIQRVNSLLKKELSQIILREAEIPQGCLVTITRIETSVDLKESKIYLAILPEEKSEEIIRYFKKIVYFLQQKLNKRLKLNPIPKIIFLKDRESQKAGRVEEILEELKKEKK